VQEFHITSAKLTGNPGESGWSQVHEFKPEEEEKLSKRGHLFAVISTGGQKEGVDSVVAGRELLSRLHEEYFGKMEISAFNALKRAVETVIDEFTDTWGGVEIAAVSIVEGIVYSAAGGGASVHIFRKGMLAPILKSKKGEIISASGHPQLYDQVILATQEFMVDTGEGVLKGALETGSPADVVESFAPMVHAKESAGSVGVCVVGFGEQEELAPIDVEKEVKEPTPQKEEIKPEVTVSSPSFFKKAFDLAKSTFPGKRLYVRKSEIDVEDAQKKRLAITTGIILIILLFVSIFFGVRQKRINEERARYQERLTRARHELDEAKSLFTLSPDRARELFANAAQIVQQLEDEGVEDEELAQLKEELQVSRQIVLGEHDVASEQFLDLSLLNDTKVDQLTSTVDAIYVLDKGSDRVVEVVVGTKRTETVAGPAQIRDALQIAVYAERVFVEEDEGIYEVGDARTQAVEKEWSGDILYNAYAANLYVLGKSESKIWRYVGTDAGFSSQSDWLAPGVEPDLSGVISMAIDGSIWILTESGNIEKYTRGNSQPISDISASPEMVNPTIIYTNEELDNIYILDPETARVVSFDKEGNYVAQYRSEVFRTSNGLFVSESLGKIIVSSENKLYSVDLVKNEE
jgi:hypothetical protein